MQRTQNKKFILKKVENTEQGILQDSIYTIQRHPTSQNKLLLLCYKPKIKRTGFHQVHQIDGGNLYLHEVSQDGIRLIKTIDCKSLTPGAFSTRVLGTTLKDETYQDFSHKLGGENQQKTILLNFFNKNRFSVDFSDFKIIGLGDRLGDYPSPARDFHDKLQCITLHKTSLITSSRFLHSSFLLGRKTYNMANINTKNTFSTLIWNARPQKGDSKTRLVLQPRFLVRLLSESWQDYIRTEYHPSDLRFNYLFQKVLFAGSAHHRGNMNSNIMSFWYLKRKSPFFIFAFYDNRRSKMFRRVLIEKSDLVRRCMRLRPGRPDVPQLKDFKYNPKTDRFYFIGTWTESKEIAVCCVEGILRGNAYSPENIKIWSFCPRRMLLRRSLEDINLSLHFMGEDVVVTTKDQVYLLNYNNSDKIEMLSSEDRGKNEFEYFLAMRKASNQRVFEISEDRFLVLERDGICRVLDTKDRRVVSTEWVNQKGKKDFFPSFISLKDDFNIALYPFNKNGENQPENSSVTVGEGGKLNLIDLIYPKVIKDVKLVEKIPAMINSEEMHEGAPDSDISDILLVVGLGAVVAKKSRRRWCLLLRLNHRMEVQKKRVIGDSFEGFQPSHKQFVDYQIMYLLKQNKILIARTSHIKSIKDSFMILDTEFNTLSTLDYKISPKAKVLVLSPTPSSTIVALYPIRRQKAKRKVIFFNLDPESSALREDTSFDVELEGKMIVCAGRMNKFIPVGSEIENKYFTSLKFFNVEARKHVEIKIKIWRGPTRQILIMPYKEDKFFIHLVRKGYQFVNGFFMADPSTKSILDTRRGNFSYHWNFNPDYGLPLRGGGFVFYDCLSCREIQFDRE